MTCHLTSTVFLLWGFHSYKSRFGVDKLIEFRCHFKLFRSVEVHPTLFDALRRTVLVHCVPYIATFEN